MNEDNKNIILNVENLTVAFGKNIVIEGLSFQVHQGDVLAIVGPNGAGKSVLLRTLLGLIPHKGSLIWNKNIRIGYVPQKLFVENSFPLNVREFLAFKSKSESLITDALNSVGIDKKHDQENILNQKLGLLSGGQFQRILIAWSILDNPNILLFDEPTSGIDIGGEETIYNLLHELQDKKQLTIILISHDLNVVYKYANNVLCINKQQLCFGEPNLVLDPQSLSQLYGGETKFYHHSHPHS